MSHAHIRSFGAAKDEVFSCVVSIHPEECGLTRAEFRFGRLSVASDTSGAGGENRGYSLSCKATYFEPTSTEPG